MEILLSKNFNIEHNYIVLFRELIYQKLGIYIAENKDYQIKNKLEILLKKADYEDISKFYRAIKNDHTESIEELIKYITINYTYFFRESKHFEFLTQIGLPQVVRAKPPGDKDLRIWCAGCASGEEAYGIVITMLEYFGLGYSAWDAGLLATDTVRSYSRTWSSGSPDNVPFLKIKS